MKCIKFISLVAILILTMTGCSTVDNVSEEEKKAEEASNKREQMINEFNKKTSDLLEQKQYSKEEISGLQDFQMVDKIYDNEVLERYNKIQMYLYNVVVGRDTVEILELFPPTNTEEIKKAEQIGHTYEFLGNIIAPCYFEYYEGDQIWYKYGPFSIDKSDSQYWGLENQYKYISDDELTRILGIQTPYEKLQLPITK